MLAPVMVLPCRQPLNWAVMLWPAVGPWGAGTALQVAGQGTITASQTQVLRPGPVPPVTSSFLSETGLAPLCIPGCQMRPGTTDREWRDGAGRGWAGRTYLPLWYSHRGSEASGRANWGCETSRVSLCCKLAFSHVDFWS